MELNLVYIVNNYFGQKLREIREEKKILLRQIASYLEVDTALISKIEKGDRKPNKEQVAKISKLLSICPDELLMLWMSDKIDKTIGDDLELGLKAIDFLKKVRK